MKIGQKCIECGYDHWIIRKKGGSRWGVCDPGTHNEKRQFPRILPVNHSEFIRKATPTHKKPWRGSCHRAIISDVQLGLCVAFTVDKIITDENRWHYRITPIYKNEFNDFRSAKRFFLKSKLASQQKMIIR